jgi:hypothetical protein
MREEPPIAIESLGEETPQLANARAAASRAGGLKFIPFAYTCWIAEGSLQFPENF